MAKDLKWMIGSDFHIPYHHPKYVDLWFKVMKWFKPDIVDYAGDIDDQSCFSRFSQDTPDELLNRVSTYAGDVKTFYKDTSDIVPEADKFVALGNHDIRVFDYIDKKAPAFKGYITPESMWGLDTLGYNYIYYSDRPQHRYGDIYVHHGDSISKHAGESVRNDVQNHGVSLIRGHSHRQGHYNKSYEITGQELRGWEIGHMTDINSEGMSYTNSHDWQAGFAIGHIHKDYPHIQLIRIAPDFSCVVDGKVFQA